MNVFIQGDSKNKEKTKKKLNVVINVKLDWNKNLSLCHKKTYCKSELFQTVFAGFTNI